MRHTTAILAGSLLLATVTQATARPGWVTGEAACHEAAGANYEVVYTFPSRVAVDIRNCVYGWCSVYYQNYSCWVAQSYIGYDAGYAPAPEPEYVPPAPAYEPPPPPPRPRY